MKTNPFISAIQYSKSLSSSLVHSYLPVMRNQQIYNVSFTCFLISHYEFHTESELQYYQEWKATTDSILYINIMSDSRIPRFRYTVCNTSDQLILSKEMKQATRRKLWNSKKEKKS